MKAIGWSIAFLLIGFVFTVICYCTYAALRFADFQTGLATLQVIGAEQLLVAGVSQLLGFGLATWLIGRRVLHLGADDLRWRAVGPRVRGFGLGMTLGLAAALGALLLAVPAGGLWTRDAGSFGQYLVRLGATLGALAPAALSEEVVFRGLPLVLLAAAFGRWKPVVVLSLLFAAAHARNLDATTLGLANIALAGVLLGVAFFAPGGIWTAFGVHLGWNLTLAAADAPVSGLPFRIPFIDHLPGTPGWFTGGRFGPEGGLVATIAISAAILATQRWTRRTTS